MEWVLLIPIFAAIGAFFAGALAACCAGFDLLFGTSIMTADRAFGLVIVGAAFVEIGGWCLLAFEECRHG